MCFLRSKIFTFSKMLLTSIFDRKEQTFEKIETNTEEQLAYRRTTGVIIFLSMKRLTSIEYKRLPSSTKVKIRAKDDKMIFQSDTLKAVDVTFLDVLVRQNDPA